MSTIADTPTVVAWLDRIRNGETVHAIDLVHPRSPLTVEHASAALDILIERGEIERAYYAPTASQQFFGAGGIGPGGLRPSNAPHICFAFRAARRLS